jgi:hypothetical protein
MKGGSHRRIVSRWRTLKGSKHILNGAITISIGGKRTYLGRVVLATFVGPCPQGMECCHGDGDPANNNLWNLRWDTRAANVSDTIRHGRHPAGERNHFAKLTAEQVHEIVRLRASGWTQLEIAKRFGVERSNISQIVNGKSWKSLARETIPPQTPSLPL